MIHSMTGYGKATAEYDGKKIYVEIKSLNSKNLDLSTRIVSLYREKEIEIRKRIAEALERGKIELNIWCDKLTAQKAATINTQLCQDYWQQMEQLSTSTGIALPSQEKCMQLLLKMPDVLQNNNHEELSNEEWAVVQTAIDQAVENLKAFRAQEGAALAVKFEQNLQTIAALMQQITPYEQERIEKVRQRLEEKLTELHIDYDKNRLEQELIYYIEKFDINEEKQRLTNHLSYFRSTMHENSGQGKKLGFIAQEMGREINTTGSKSNHAQMQNIVVKMKDELEQIKEQVLNVL